MIRIRAVVGVATLALLLVGCGGGGGGGGSSSAAPHPQGTLAGDAELLMGRRIYIDRCSACHGSAGQGSVGPSFTDGKLLDDFATVDDQVAFVTNGRGVMPAFGAMLDDDEIRAVVRYEREVLSKAGAR